MCGHRGWLPVALRPRVFNGRRPFWLAFLAAFVVALGLLGATGAGLSVMLVRPPPERFATSTFDFDLQPGWKCARDGTEIVCNAGKPPHSTIAVIARKNRSAEAHHCRDCSEVSFCRVPPLP